MKTKLPKDLGIKIGSEKQAFLEKVKTAMLEENKSNRMAIYLNERLIKTISDMITEEKEKFK